MKKFFATLLTLAMTAALLAGCGSSGSTGASSAPAASQTVWPPLRPLSFFSRELAAEVVRSPVSAQSTSGVRQQ